jgi:surface polysaccharide O-acyltransferase-like enzyme
MKKITLITNGLIIFSLIIVPIAFIYFGTDSNAAYKSGEYWGECLWILLIPYIATRKRTDKTKDNVSLFAAILLLIFSIITIYNTYNEQEAMKIAASNFQLLNENKDLLDTKSTGNNLGNLLNGIVKVVEPYNKK